MRPHRLSLEAIGPYADPVTIDFDSVTRDGLFLIHGPTGSGKTFILDAIAYALYGQVPGGREAGSVHSQHAGPSSKPLVELEFSVGSDRYLIERTPAYTAQKQRGEGTTARTGSASLQRLGGKKPKVLASKLKDVNDEIKNLIGLTAEQFFQVIMLPQGQFQEVLRADSNTRETLLKTMFDTTLYEGISDYLKDLADDAKEELSQCDTARRELVSRAINRAEEVELLDADEFSELPEDGSCFEILKSRYATARLRAKNEVETIAAERKQAEELASQTKRIADLWDRHKDLRGELDLANSKTKDVEKLAQELARANRAEELRDDLAHIEELDGQIADDQERITSTKAEFRDKRDGIDKVPPAVKKVKLTGWLERKPLQDALKVTHTFIGTLSELAKDEARATELAGKAGGLLEQLQTAHYELAELIDARRVAADVMDKRKVELESAKSAQDRLPLLEKEYEAAKKTAVAAQKLSNANDELAKLNKELSTAEQQFLSAKKKALDLREKHLDGIAATLASELQDNQPCPVCGSKDHPKPATSKTALIDKSEVDAAEARAKDAETDFEDLKEKVDDAKGNARLLEGEAGSAARDPQKAIDGEAGAGRELNEATELASQADDLAAALKEATNSLDGIDTKISRHEEKITADEAEARSLEDQVEQLQREIEKAIGKQATVAEVSQAVDALRGTTEELIAAHDQLEGAEDVRRQLIARLDKKLKSKKFRSLKEARDSLRDERDRNALETQVNEQNELITALEEQLKNPDFEDLPKDRPDIEAAQKAKDEAAERESDAANKKGQLEVAGNSTNEWLKDYHRLSKQYERTEKDLTLKKGVADRCAGSVAPRISLQRWVLGNYLEEICKSANARLANMTGSRYHLRVHRDVESHGKHAGLGLRVFDTFTGDAREVTTLSGGETFQASLALALGVADIAQAHAGGIHIDALFVDEGFGSLDPDSLQVALDELDRLREGGRMVGAISHVGAMRERIHTGIEVVPSEKGSTVRVGNLQAE